MGVGETGVGETGVGETGVGETGIPRLNNLSATLSGVSIEVRISLASRPN